MEFNKALKVRRSQYAITNTIKLPEEKVLEVIKDGVRHTPSPYNMQSTRAVVLLGENHKTLWNIEYPIIIIITTTSYKRRITSSSSHCATTSSYYTFPIEISSCFIFYCF